MHRNTVPILVERVVINCLVVDEVLGNVVVDVLLVRGGGLVVAELPERHGEEQGQADEEGNPPAARSHDDGRLKAFDARIALMHAFRW